MAASISLPIPLDTTGDPMLDVVTAYSQWRSLRVATQGLTPLELVGLPVQTRREIVETWARLNYLLESTATVDVSQAAEIIITYFGPNG